MELISKLIEIALYELQDLAVIDWTPDDGAPESFIAECEIEHSPSHLDWLHSKGDFYVTMLGVLCFVSADTMECWFSTRIDEAVAV